MAITKATTNAAQAGSNDAELSYAMEALVVELATDPWLSTLKVAELKPDAMPVLAGMLLAWHARAKALHQDILAAVAMAKKAGANNAASQGRARDVQAVNPTPTIRVRGG